MAQNIGATDHSHNIAGSGPKILIVEDESVIAEDLSQVLSRAGYNVVGICGEGAQALEFCSTVKVDLVLLDIVINGDIDGIETARLLREISDPPIVFVSAYTDEDTVKRSISLSPYGYLVKPFSDRELEITVELALYKAAMARKLKKSEQRLELAIEASDMGLWEWRRQTGIKALNKKTDELLGNFHTPSNREYTHWRDIIHPDDAPEIEKAFEDHFQGLIPAVEVEARLAAKGNRWTQIRGKTVEMGLDGRPNLVEGAILDISDRKESERLIKENHEFTETVMNRSQVGIATYRWDGCAVSVNEAIARTVGATVDQALSQNFREIESWKVSGLLEDAEHTLSTGEERRGEKHLVTSWGKTVWLEYRMSRFYSGDAAHLLLLVDDITERKETEVRIRESEEKLRIMTDSLPVIIAYVDRNRRYQFVNRTFERWRGISKERAKGAAISDVLTDDVYELAADYVDQALSGAPVSFRVEESAENGETKQLEFLYVPHFGEDGVVKGFAALIRDITDSIRTEQELKDQSEKLEATVNERTRELLEMNERLWSEITERKKIEKELKLEREQLLSIFDSMDDMVIVVDPENYEIVYMNRAGKKALGYDPTGGLCHKEIHGFDRVCSFCPNRSLDISDDKALSWENFNESMNRYQLITDRLIQWTDGRRVKLSIATDISELKTIERTLRARERLYRTVVETSEEGLWIIDPDGSTVFHNSRLSWMLGYDEEEISRRRLFDFIHESWRESAIAGLDKCSSGLKLKQDLKFVRSDGSEMWAIVSWAPILEDGLNVKAALAMISDITERKLAEEENRKTAMSMRSLIEAAPMGIGIFHGNRHVYVNPAFVKMFGYQDADEILDKPIEALYIEGDRDLALEKIRDNASGSSKGASYSAMGLKKDGTEFDLQAWTASVQYDGKTASLVFVIDVSETKSLRAQLVQAQKMEAVGTLAGGIAHDFNNLLTVAMGYAELILMDLNEGDRHYEELQIIGKAAKDGSDLVQRILTFSRKVEPEPKPVNMNNEIKRIHKLLERTIPKMIRIELNLATEIKVVHADPGQIEQAVLNLALNAKDAMGEEGTLTIETANTRLDEDFCRNNIGLTPGQYVKISIKDTGPGIPKEHLDRIFEPFFTTKKRGEGTGLGLAMVFGIVRSHSGHINCVSHIGKGATFNIYLPVRKFETREEQETNTTYVTQGDELILIVDDEESIRRLGTRLLQKAGYNTLTAKNGLEAIEVFRDRKDDVSLVILDLIMPEMGGKKCLEELFRINPDLKVLVASGYSAEAPVEEVMAMGARKFLAKPYSRRDLLESVRKTLDTDGSGAD